MELNLIQQEVVNSDERRIVVVSAAASGKTAVVVERLRRLLNDGVDPKSIVAITYTNMAAENILDRLGDKAKGMFVGTVHSYANYILLSHGYDTFHYLQAEDFDGLFRLVKKHPDCVYPIEHLIVDETQDSTDNQFDFFEMLHPTNFMYVGDARQSIYRYASADPDRFLQLMNNPDNVIYHLNHNYRCAPEILTFAKNIIRLNGPDYADDSIAMQPRGSGEVRQVQFNPDALIKGIQEFGHYGEWFVLCRTNDEIDVLCETLHSYGVPYDTFKKKDLTLAQLNKRLQADTVKVLTVHASKGLEANYVAVVDPRFYNTEEKCISYVAATRAKKLLVWTTMPPRRKQRPTGTTSWE